MNRRFCSAKVSPFCAIFLSLVFCGGCKRETSSSSRPEESTNAVRTYSVTGIVPEIRMNPDSLVVAHEAIPNYMDAMTMPFKVRDPAEIASLRTNDRVTFQLSVTADRSWIDHITVLNSGAPSPVPNAVAPGAKQLAAPKDPDPFTFTNEFGKRVNLKDFRDQPLALTFFFTRCPIPDYCPRLSRNFAEASQSLASATNAPARWHFLSISIDPEHDTPEALRRYAETYHYDSNHWSFLTGPKERVSNLAHMFGFEYQPDGAFFSHSFRTIIINSSNQVQQIFPFTGNFSDEIAKEMIKAAK